MPDKIDSGSVEIEDIETSTVVDGVESGVSRRQFVQGVGGVAFAAAFGGFSVGTFSYMAVSGGYIQVDHTECAGCTSCMAACSLVHEGAVNLSLARIQIIKNDLTPFPNDISMNQCHQCMDAPCVAVCPTGALSIDAAHGNVRRIDPTKCIGCKTCVTACPFTPVNLQFHPKVSGGVAPVSGAGASTKQHVMGKCDLCTNAPFWNRPSGPGVANGQACVAVCPAQAIKYVTDISTGYDKDFYAALPNVRGWGTVTA